MMREAEDIYSQFTGFSVDRRHDKCLLFWPDPGELCCYGHATMILYKSDKHFDPEGEYYHPFEHVQTTLLLGPPLNQSQPPAPYYIPPPPANKIAMMGYQYSHCLDIIYIDQDGQNCSTNFEQLGQYPFIAVHPNGRTLIIFYPASTPVLVDGPTLRITERGIEG